MSWKQLLGVCWQFSHFAGEYIIAYLLTFLHLLTNLLTYLQAYFVYKLACKRILPQFKTMSNTFLYFKYSNEVNRPNKKCCLLLVMQNCLLILFPIL